MSTLCIDIGNTSSHFGCVHAQGVSQRGQFPTNLLQQSANKTILEQLAPLIADCDSVAFCSVVPEANKKLKQALLAYNLPIFQLDHLSCRGLTLAYPTPKEIGQDRLANAIAAQANYGTPAIVIDLGTAVTFDIITSRGYEGGLIAPGINVMTRYLHEQTALLPCLDADHLVSEDHAIGKSTISAMQLGIAIGFSGMIEALLQRVLEELKGRNETPPTILSTGGSVANLTQDWEKKCQFVPDLTLIGLREAYSRARLSNEI
jgi:type III pantothenate kinase